MTSSLKSSSQNSKMASVFWDRQPANPRKFTRVIDQLNIRDDSQDVIMPEEDEDEEEGEFSERRDATVEP